VTTPARTPAAPVRAAVRASDVELAAASATWLLAVAGCVLLIWAWLPAAMAITQPSCRS